MAPPPSAHLAAPTRACGARAARAWSAAGWCRRLGRAGARGG